MAVKTITIDMDAYRRLKNAKRGQESFSEVIKRIVPKPVDLEKLFADLDRLGPFSREFVDGVERVRTPRRRRRAQ